MSVELDEVEKAVKFWGGTREEYSVVRIFQVPERSWDVKNSGDFAIKALATLLDIEEEMSGERGQPGLRPFV